MCACTLYRHVGYGTVHANSPVQRSGTDFAHVQVQKLPIFLRTGTNEIFRRADDHFGAGRRRANSRHCILTAAPAAGRSLHGRHRTTRKF